MHENYVNTLAVDDARLKLMQSIPISKYLKDHKYLYMEEPRGKIKCPIHNDNSPSCFYNDNEQSFNCFGCKSGGGVVELHMGIKQNDDESYNQLKSILALAKEYNVDIPNMFERGEAIRPRHRGGIRNSTKYVPKHSEAIIERKLERIETRLALLNIPDRLKAYQAIDKYFLGELDSKIVLSTLERFLKSRRL